MGVFDGKHGEITLHLKNRLDHATTKAGWVGTRLVLRRLGLSLSFGREVAPNGTILPLQSTEQQAGFKADLLGSLESLQIFVQHKRLQNLPLFECFRGGTASFMWSQRVQDTLADGQNRSIPCRDLHWGCLVKHRCMLYN